MSSALPAGYDSDPAVALAMLKTAMAHRGLDAVQVQRHGDWIVEGLRAEYPELLVYVNPISDAIMWPRFGSLDVTVDSGIGGFYFRADGAATWSEAVARTYAADHPIGTTTQPQPDSGPDPVVPVPDPEWANRVVKLEDRTRTLEAATEAALAVMERRLVKAEIDLSNIKAAAIANGAATAGGVLPTGVLDAVADRIIGRILDRITGAATGSKI